MARIERPKSGEVIMLATLVRQGYETSIPHWTEFLGIVDQAWFLNLEDLWTQVTHDDFPSTGFARLAVSMLTTYG